MIYYFIAAAIILGLALALTWALSDRAAFRGEVEGMTEVLEDARDTVARAEALKAQVREANEEARLARTIAADARAESRNWQRIAGTSQLEAEQARAETVDTQSRLIIAEDKAARWRRIAGDALALMPGEQTWSADDTVTLHAVEQVRT